MGIEKKHGSKTLRVSSRFQWALQTPYLCLWAWLSLSTMNSSCFSVYRTGYLDICTATAINLDCCQILMLHCHHSLLGLKLQTCFISLWIPWGKTLPCLFVCYIYTHFDEPIEKQWKYIEYFLVISRFCLSFNGVWTNNIHILFDLYCY